LEIKYFKEWSLVFSDDMSRTFLNFQELTKKTLYRISFSIDLIDFFIDNQHSI